MSLNPEPGWFIQAEENNCDDINSKQFKNPPGNIVYLVNGSILNARLQINQQQRLEMLHTDVIGRVVRGEILLAVC